MMQEFGTRASSTPTPPPGFQAFDAAAGLPYHRRFYDGADKLAAELDRAFGLTTPTPSSTKVTPPVAYEIAVPDHLFVKPNNAASSSAHAPELLIDTSGHSMLYGRFLSTRRSSPSRSSSYRVRRKWGGSARSHDASSACSALVTLPPRSRT